MRQCARVWIGVMCLSAWLMAGEWVMFSDGKDTYIYSSNTGEIYIRHHLGKKNYEDMFVKMPRGMQPSEINAQNTTSQTHNADRKSVV